MQQQMLKAQAEAAADERRRLENSRGQLQREKEEAIRELRQAQSGLHQVHYPGGGGRENGGGAGSTVGALGGAVRWRVAVDDASGAEYSRY